MVCGVVCAMCLMCVCVCGVRCRVFDVFYVCLWVCGLLCSVCDVFDVFVCGVVCGIC